MDKDKMVEELLNMILSKSFVEDGQKTGMDSEALRKRALQIVRMDNIKNHWGVFAHWVNKICPANMSGHILDFGCGYGNMVYYGLNHGYNIQGIDIDQTGIAFYKKRVQLNKVPLEWMNQCQVGDIQDMSFDSNYFSAIYSYYVLEHIDNLGSALREMVRVVQSGGVIYLKAQDAQRFYEGHYNIPWLPFMPKRVARIWLKEFGKPDGHLDCLHYITGDQVISILKAFGCRIIFKRPLSVGLIPNHWQLHTEKDIRETAQKVKKLFKQGKWMKRTGAGIFVIAIKE